MILFFYGEDTYRLKKKVRELKDKFISASLGDTNLSVLDGKTETYDNITRQILAFPFLAKSRLVIIENLIKEGKAETKEKILEFLSKVPETTVLVFIEEGIPDRRTSLFKKLNQPKVSQEFKLFEPIDLQQWILKEVKDRGGEIDSGAIQKLIEYVGNDLWRMANELDKLTTYDQKLNVESIEMLVKPQVESNIFDLIDNIAAKNQKRSLKELHNLLENGEAELKILTMIVYQFRNLIIVRDFMERGVSNQYDMAKKAGLHPFVAGKTLAQARNYSMDDLKSIYRLLLDNDLAIKTGQTEPKTALDLLVVKLCKN